MRKPTASARRPARAARPQPRRRRPSRSRHAPRAKGRGEADRAGAGARRTRAAGAATDAGRAGERPDAGDRSCQAAGRPPVEPVAAQPRQVRLLHHRGDRAAASSAPIGIGADPSDVYTVHYKNLAAVVSDAPIEVLDSTRENVLAHERVNETVMREHTVIPMSFGTIFKTREDIVELLRSAAEAFGDVLNKMQNKLEFGLKVLWDRDQAVREVEAEDEDIRRLKKEISGAEGADLLRAHAVRPAGRRRAAAAVGALRRRDPRRAARRVGGLAHQQADRRQDDHERRVPRLSATRSRRSTRRSRRSPAASTS